MVGSAKKDEETLLNHAAENLRLVQDNQKLLEENKALEKIRSLLSEQVECLKVKTSEQEGVVQKMQEAINKNDIILEKLRDIVEKDATKISTLEGEIRMLKAEAKKKDELIEKQIEDAAENLNLMNDAMKEIVENRDLIYAEYENALATFGIELEPLPQDPEGEASGLLN